MYFIYILYFLRLFVIVKSTYFTQSGLNIAAKFNWGQCTSLFSAMQFGYIYFLLHLLDIFCGKIRLKSWVLLNEYHYLRKVVWLWLSVTSDFFTTFWFWVWTMLPIYFMKAYDLHYSHWRIDLSLITSQTISNPTNQDFTRKLCSWICEGLNALELSNDSRSAYLIFVIFCRPPHF